jgi:putative transcriptional regulator
MCVIDAQSKSIYAKARTGFGEQWMAKITGRALRARDAKRNLGAELLASVREMQAGRARRVQRVSVSAIAEARARSGLSRQRFAELLGVSPRTLQEWEQGRRHPSGAARSLLAIAARRPDVLREVFG